MENKRVLPPRADDQIFNANGNPFKITYGDLIELAKNGKFDVIVHGCNCHCVMGAGIAKTIRDTWPAAYEADLKTKKGDRSKLGTYSFAKVGDLVIVNLYTQFNYTRDKVDIEYEAFISGLKRIREDFHGKRIGFPMIGAGLASGNWGMIKEMIGDELKGEDVTVVIFRKNIVPSNDEVQKDDQKQQW